MLTRNSIFYGVVIIQGTVLLFLVLSQVLPFDVMNSPYNWFHKSNQEIIVTKQNKTYMCIPIKPKARPGAKIFLMIIVTSRSLKEDSREAIRETWAKSLKQESSILLVFVIGCTRSIHLDRDVDREARQFPDIIRVSYNEDEKRYGIRRLLHAYRIAVEFQPKYMIKVQDDVYIHLPKLIPWLKSLQSTTSLYAGRVHKKVEVHRDLQSKSYVSEQEYPGKTFPDYCSGAFYILSGDLLTKIIQIQNKVPSFDIEDVYIGVVVSRLKVEPNDIGHSVTYISPRTPHEIQSWKNDMFKELLAIGYNLPPNMMQYIYDRHQRIVHPKDTVE